MSAPRRGARARRRGVGHEAEPPENHERWMISYADMMTLLMVLFIVLFAISQVDQKKFAALKDGLTAGFGATSTMPLSGGKAILTQDGVVPAPVDLSTGMGTKQDSEKRGSAQQSQATQQLSQQQTVQLAKQEAARLQEIENKIRKALDAKHLRSEVRFRITDRGLVVALISDDVFFENASADLRPRGRDVLSAVGPVLRPLPEEIAVEGHANRLKMRGGAYPSNWELSAARASGVVRYLISSQNIADTRLSATGYGSSRPLFPASDPRAISYNRRVDLVLVSRQPAAVRNLLPQIAPQLSDEG
ncbi:MAG TPA: flagellar motor protein MotB [Actinomycetales bacterium]|nr:flagellar motor protein MotB [Actinomycetales bacterium]